jgi:hypothetical protein
MAERMAVRWTGTSVAMMDALTAEPSADRSAALKAVAKVCRLAGRKAAPSDYFLAVRTAGLMAATTERRSEFSLECTWEQAWAVRLGSRASWSVQLWELQKARTLEYTLVGDLGWRASALVLLWAVLWVARSDSRASA